MPTLLSDRIEVDTSRVDLNEILSAKEPVRTQTLMRWMDDYTVDDTVLIKPSSGSAVFEAGLKRNTLRISARGTRVSKHLALELLQRYGKNGKYTGKHKASGLTHGRWLGLTETQREFHHNIEPEYEERYLVHVPSWASDEEAETSSEPFAGE